MRTIGDIATAHPDKALLAAGDFNIPELGWTRTEAGWAARVFTNCNRAPPWGKTALNYRRADWEGLRTSLSRTPWILLDDGLPVDEAADRFYDLLNAAIRDHIPVVTLRRRQPPWFDGELRAALREEGAHRRLKRHRTPVTEEAFRQQ
ncbi:hypothetical protein FJT64_010539 [Amphibalanus amphitrite]|uniref:Endonuclease/exonuclease/phosphatase domain-containing protein n=1 Tax=Amphibalanus amphitrite TaxID=1232801 RepID=A0A6A4VM09_AMPAM|nr:hypothetical protein FJT64_010539 [Amphibalanus amphitrite]